jgi:CubicO group peptidase (beta-lactamase class C family)
VTDDLEAALRPAMEALRIPGAAVGVVDGRLARTWCAGVTSVDHPLPVTDTTIFQIGSISKTFVGTAVMALVDQGSLELDAPLRSYVPDLHLSTDELTEQVTMRHLLTHTTGWVGDYFADTGDGDDALARFAGKLTKAPQLTPLGAVYSYNNSAFNLAAHVVATIAGVPYERAVKDLILEPLGMQRTYYRTEDAIGGRIAVGHRDGRAQGWRRPRAHNGAGGVLSCVADLLVYAQFHLGDGSPLMRRSTLEQMHAPSRPAGSLCDWVGLVWMIDHYAGVEVVHHGGTTNGYMADLRLVPERDLAWVMLTNSDHDHQLDRVIMTELLGSDTDQSAYVPDDLSPYAGRYEAVLADLEVTVAGDHLRLDVATPSRAMWNRGEDPGPPRSTRLAFRDPDRVICLDLPFSGHRGEFLFGDDGKVEWLRWDGRIARRSPP